MNINFIIAWEMANHNILTSLQQKIGRLPKETCRHFSIHTTRNIRCVSLASLWGRSPRSISRLALSSSIFLTPPCGPHHYSSMHKINDNRNEGAGEAYGGLIGNQLHAVFDTHAHASTCSVKKGTMGK